MIFHTKRLLISKYLHPCSEVIINYAGFRQSGSGVRGTPLQRNCKVPCTQNIVCFPSPPVYGMWHPVRKPVWSHLNSRQDCFILISSCLYIYGANPITRYFIFEFVASSFWFARFLTRVNWNSLGMCKLYATSQLCPGAVAVSSKEHVSTGSRHWLACDTSLHQ